MRAAFVHCLVIASCAAQGAPPADQASADAPPDVIVHVMDADGRPIAGVLDVDVRGLDGRIACVQVEADATGHAPLLLVEGRRIGLHGSPAVDVPKDAPVPFPVELRLAAGVKRPPWCDEPTVPVEIRDLPVPDGTVAFALTRMKGPEVLQWRSRVQAGRATFRPPSRLWWIEVHPVRASDPRAVAPRTVVLAPAAGAAGRWTAYTGRADSTAIEPTVRADGTIELSWHQLAPRE
jgi:hypothetical protein